MAESIEADPASKENLDGLYLFNKKARKKLQTIREEIAHLQAKKRKEEGREIFVAGYSGRKTNRR
jgi:hypothetical protein